ncbi:MAG: hypothetical protein ACKVZ6_22515 [Kineosporiaceae bacterium]|jgi:hypothetical protein
MTDTDFDGLGALTGAVTSVVVLDPDGTPNKVLDSGLPFGVRIRWTVTPPATAAVLDGQWGVRVFAESIGPGPEVLIGQTAVAADGGVNYTTTITVPAGTLPADVPPLSGAYKLVVVITYRNSLNVLTEIAAFSEGPIVLIRQP